MNDDSQIPGPGDGSGGLVPGWSEPFVGSLPTTDSRVEGAWHRENFTEGRWFKGADGFDWCLPVLDETAWDSFGLLREYFELPLMLEYDAEGKPLSNVMSAQKLWYLLFQLLEGNYYAPSSELIGVFTTGPDHWDFQPLVELLAHITASPDLNVYHVADIYGLDRREVGELSKIHATVAAPLLGWHHHDGPLFNN